MPDVTTVRRLASEPCATWHRKDESELHSVHSPAERIRILAVIVWIPKCEPKRFTITGDAAIIFPPSPNPLMLPLVVENMALALPTCSPTVSTALRLSDNPCDVKQTVAESDSQEVCSHLVSPS